MPILETSESESSAASIEKAVGLIREGEVVGLPSETVYGLAADATNTSAVEKIFSTKGRPSHNPLIIHVSDASMAAEYVKEWPTEAQLVADAFWPGPLTMVLPHNGRVSERVTAGGDTVAVRVPAHPVFRKVIEQSGCPLAAPSANRSNHISPTLASHVVASLGDQVTVLDGGASPVGIESTVLDLTCKPAKVLRPGMISAAAIAGVLGDCQSGNQSQSEVLKSPGQLSRHYAPKAPLVLFDPETEKVTELMAHYGVNAGEAVVLGHLMSGVPEENLPQRVLPGTPERFAQSLYAELHACDQSECRLILMQKPPTGPEWEAIHDRLRRSAQ